MKIPAHVLGLLIVGLVAPAVGGCAGDIEDNDPSSTTTQAQKQEPGKEAPAQPTEKPASKPASVATPAPTPPEPTPTPAPRNEDPCPPCGMG